MSAQKIEQVRENINKTEYEVSSKMSKVLRGSVEGWNSLLKDADRCDKETLAYRLGINEEQDIDR